MAKAKKFSKSATTYLGSYNQGKELYKQGQAAVEIGDLDRAKVLYNQAIEFFEQSETAKPDYVASYHWHGKALYALGQVEKGQEIEEFARHYNDAITNFNKAIKLSPNQESIYSDKGQISFSLKDYNGAIGCFSTAIGLNSKMPILHYKKGKALHALGDKEKEEENEDSMRHYSEADECYGVAFGLSNEQDLRHDILRDKAKVLYALGKDMEAAACLKETEDLSNSVMAEYHPQVLINSSSSAVVSLVTESDSKEFVGYQLLSNTSISVVPTIPTDTHNIVITPISKPVEETPIFTTGDCDHYNTSLAAPLVHVDEVNVQTTGDTCCSCTIS